MNGDAGDEGALDGVTVDDLRDQLGDDVLERILVAYLEELPRYLGDLHAALEIGDATAAARAAHSLKGASRLIGGHPLGGACESIELSAKRGKLEGLDAQLVVVDRLSAAIEAAVRERIDR